MLFQILKGYILRGLKGLSFQLQQFLHCLHQVAIHFNIHLIETHIYLSSSFQEPSYQEQSFESVTFHLPAIIIQPEPIATLPPLHTPFTS